MKRAAAYIILACILCCSYTSSAQTYGLRFFTENDFLSPLAKNKDDNYTGGAKLEVVFKTKNGFDLLPLSQNAVPRKVLYNSVAFTGTAFTPQNLDSFNVVKDDRPYASVIAISIGSQYSSTKDPKVKFGYELSVGKMGDPAAGTVQGQIHRHEILKFISTNRPNPKGWHNQVANGGAFIANLNVNYERLLLQSKNKTDKFFIPFRLSLRNNFNAGNYLINSSHGLRINLLNKQYDFDEELAPPEIIKITGKTKAAEKPRVFSFSLYAEPRVKINIHNAGLTGKLLSRESVHTIYTTTYPAGLTPLLFEYEMGFVVRYYFLQAGFSFQGRSREFSAQNKPMHHWAGIYLAVVRYK